MILVYPRYSTSQPRNTRCSSCRTGWAGDQHHAVGLQNAAFEFLEGLRLKAQLGHIQPEVFLVQQAHDNLFAVQGRDGRNTEVEFLFLAFGLGT